MPSLPQTSGTKRWIYFSIGWLFFGLGVVGAFLPVLPTTPLMIIALWAFSKSSERFETWLYKQRIFGPPLQRWHKYRVISAPAKMASVGAMAASLLLAAGCSGPVLAFPGGELSGTVGVE